MFALQFMTTAVIMDDHGLCKTLCFAWWVTFIYGLMGAREYNRKRQAISNIALAAVRRWNRRRERTKKAKVLLLYS